MNAQTLTRVDLRARFDTVNYDDIRRTARRYNAHFQVIGVNGVEATLTRQQLAERYPETWLTIIRASGNFAIVGEKWVLIVE